MKERRSYRCYERTNVFWVPSRAIRGLWIKSPLRQVPEAMTIRKGRFNATQLSAISIAPPFIARQRAFKLMNPPLSSRDGIPRRNVQRKVRSWIGSLSVGWIGWFDWLVWPKRQRIYWRLCIRHGKVIQIISWLYQRNWVRWIMSKLVASKSLYW